ncbi:hypothetical protein DRN72_01565 [Methanosarcinales archaeon]|nr:MAG: hypothetical protein DRN72_01565 [Methanosarcinales archaeon]
MLNVSLKFRNATFQDRDEIVEMLKEVDENFCPPLSSREVGITERVDRVLKREGSEYVLCEVDGKMVGIVGYDIHEGWAYINLLAVRPQYTGKGIGRSLLKTAEKRLEEKGIKRVKVCTWSTNEKAIMLYKSLGYYVEDILAGHRGEGIDTLIFVKTL